MGTPIDAQSNERLEIVSAIHKYLKPKFHWLNFINSHFYSDWRKLEFTE